MLRSGLVSHSLEEGAKPWVLAHARRASTISSSLHASGLGRPKPAARSAAFQDPNRLTTWLHGGNRGQSRSQRGWPPRSRGGANRRSPARDPPAEPRHESRDDLLIGEHAAPPRPVPARAAPAELCVPGKDRLTAHARVSIRVPTGRVGAHPEKLADLRPTHATGTQSARCRNTLGEGDFDRRRRLEASREQHAAKASKMPVNDRCRRPRRMLALPLPRVPSRGSRRHPLLRTPVVVRRWRADLVRSIAARRNDPLGVPRAGVHEPSLPRRARRTPRLPCAKG